MHRWKVHCGNGQTKLLPKLLCSTIQAVPMRVHQWAFGFTDPRTYSWLSWTSNLNQLIKAATIANSCSFLHFCTFSYPPLLAVNSQASNQLASREFVRFSACTIWGRGFASMRWSNCSRGYPAVSETDCLGSSVTIVAGCRVPLVCSQWSVESWAFRFDDDRIQSWDWNWCW